MPARRMRVTLPAMQSVNSAADASVSTPTQQSEPEPLPASLLSPLAPTAALTSAAAAPHDGATHTHTQPQKAPMDSSLSPSLEARHSGSDESQPGMQPSWPQRMLTRFSSQRRVASLYARPALCMYQRSGRQGM